MLAVHHCSKQRKAALIVRLDTGILDLEVGSESSPKLVSFEVSPILLSETYSQESVLRLSASVVNLILFK